MDGPVPAARLSADAIERFRTDLRALNAPDGLGVAISGGTDSLAMLLLAVESLPDGVEAVSIDHRLRPESTEECTHVARICDALGVRHETIGVDVMDRNLQSGARRARYAALQAWATRRGLSAVATAHHADDQAETVLMRLNRGSGLSGLSGIRRSRLLGQGNVRVLRPVLDWRKSELAAICAASPFAPIQDPSNHDTAFDRVALRTELARSSWLDPANIARSAAHLTAAEDYVEASLDAAWAERVLHEREPSSCTYEPGASRFENIEIVVRILELLGLAVRRSDVATMVLRLEIGNNANLGGILAKVRKTDGQWHFAAEPVRTSR